jgi:CBS domain-containing protein
LEKQNVIQFNDVLHDSFYFVASGLIHLSVIADAEETILNKCHEGAIFGLRPFLKQLQNDSKSARKHNLCYTYRGFQTVVANNAAVLN